MVQLGVWYTLVSSILRALPGPASVGPQVHEVQHSFIWSSFVKTVYYINVQRLSFGIKPYRLCYAKRSLTS